MSPVPNEWSLPKDSLRSQGSDFALMMSRYTRKGLTVNERDLFIAAVQLDNDAQRAAFLKETCAEDSALRHRVEALMHAFGKAGSFLQQPATGHVGNIILPVMEKPGTQIGPYKLLEQIGSGGTRPDAAGNGSGA